MVAGTCYRVCNYDCTFAAFQWAFQPLCKARQSLSMTILTKQQNRVPITSKHAIASAGAAYAHTPINPCVTEVKRGAQPEQSKTAQDYATLLYIGLRLT